MENGRPVLVFVTLLAACIWVGGLVAITVAASVARAQLDSQRQVNFFRALGRSYGIVGGVALLVALGGGAVLLVRHGWDGTVLAATILSAALIGATVAGVVQARAMTRLRQRAADAPNDAALTAQVRRGATRASVLRGAIAALTLALLAVAAALID